MITFLAILFFIFFIASLAVNGKNLKENEELKKKVSEYEETLKISNKIDINSTGYFKHVYFDENLKIPAILFIHIKVINKDISGENFKFDFDFERFKRDNMRRNTRVEFDSQTIQYLKLKEHQWHKIDTNEIIWSEFKDEDFTIDDFKFEEQPVEKEEFELTDFEKNDINSFLKFSNISEETKDSIRKILKM